MGIRIDFKYNHNNCGVIKEKANEVLKAFKNKPVRYSWVSQQHVLDSTNIVDLMEELRYGASLVTTDDGLTVYEIDEFLGEKLGDESEIFEILAPYMSNGYLEFSDEYGDMFRYNFVNGKLIETQGEIVFPEIDFTVK